MPGEHTSHGKNYKREARHQVDYDEMWKSGKEKSSNSSSGVMEKNEGKDVLVTSTFTEFKNESHGKANGA